MTDSAAEKTPFPPSHGYGSPVMLSMFVLWAIVFWGVFRGRRWVPVLTLVTLAWTIVLLRLHMTSAIPLNF